MPVFSHCSPCQPTTPTATKKPPTPEIIARPKKARPGNDLTSRFPLIVEALARLRSRSCIIDGEAVACDDKRRSDSANVDLMLA